MSDRALKKRANMAVCCLEGLDSFLGPLMGELSRSIDVERVVTADPRQFIDAVRRHDTVWIEWANELAHYLTTDIEAREALFGKRVILRAHSYEVLDGLADRVDYSLVSDLVFVAPHIRDLLLKRKPEVRRQVPRIHVIPNGVDLRRFSPCSGGNGFDMGWVGNLSFKKDPMVLLHAFRACHQAEPRLRLHLAGAAGNLRLSLAMQNYLQMNGLQDAVVLHGFVKDMPSWLKDKRFVVCTSLMEGHPVGLLEAMACGCRPLIYEWPGAAIFYPRRYLWRNLDELLARLTEPLEPGAVRAFVACNYSLDKQADNVLNVLRGGEEVTFTGFFEEMEQVPSEWR